MYHDYDDKQDTILCMLHFLPMEQFHNIAGITFEPYINLKNDATNIYGG